MILVKSSILTLLFSSHRNTMFKIVYSLVTTISSLSRISHTESTSNFRNWSVLHISAILLLIYGRRKLLRRPFS
ncbi:hypothetical protein [Vaccinia virus]|nr:hypothetical protein [Vaccinia virus]